MLYLSTTPKILQQLLPDLVWRIPTNRKELYLSFDDGPVPESTPWILDLLGAFQAKASFFCVGQNIERYPGLVRRIHTEGHTLGNHSYNHLSGWGTGLTDYVRNVRRGALVSQSSLYRPPYGRIRLSQSRLLRHHYTIVMWDVLSGDFDPGIDPASCYLNVVRNVQPGSIVVFHDSRKSIHTLKQVLPDVLQYFSDEGYSFRAMDANSLCKDPTPAKVAYSCPGRW